MKIWRKWLQLLRSKNVPESGLAVKYFLQHLAIKEGLTEGEACHASCHDLAECLGESSWRRFEVMCRQRLKRVPVQYILGESSFRGQVFKMAPPVLIPRPETEDLVSLVIRGEPHGHVLDVGCGSGCIAVSLALEVPELRITAIDPSEEACRLTVENALHFGVMDQINVICVTFKEFVFKSDLPSYTTIVSNPPYIPSVAMETLEPEVAQYEDNQALDGGSSGLSVAMEIMADAHRILSPCGNLWFELGLGQWESVAQAVEENQNWGLRFMKPHPDFTQRLRFCHLRREQ